MVQKKLKYMKINNFKLFQERVDNLSKVRKWDTYNFSGRRKKNKQDATDLYFIYDLKKSELGKYLNTWFKGISSKSKTGQIYRDEMITLKKVDKETAMHLYNRVYNPISINIMCPTGAKFRQDENGNDLYNMKAQIHSIDDSSYSIWWNEMSLEKLEEIREELMKLINGYHKNLNLINGDKFLDICVSLGADEDSKNYD